MVDTMYVIGSNDIGDTGEWVEKFSKGYYQITTVLGPLQSEITPIGKDLRALYYSRGLGSLLYVLGLAATLWLPSCKNESFKVYWD